jgi:hypothetical protein
MFDFFKREFNKKFHPKDTAFAEIRKLAEQVNEKTINEIDNSLGYKVTPFQNIIDVICRHKLDDYNYEDIKKILISLMDKGADLSKGYVTIFDDTPIIIAILDRRTKLIKLLIELACNYNQRESLYKQDKCIGANNTPLTLLLKYGRFNYQEKIQLILTLIDALKGHLNEKDYKQNTALHLACILGIEDVINHLCKNGADITAENHMGHTPIDYAISEIKDIVKWSISLFFSGIDRLHSSGKYIICGWDDIEHMGAYSNIGTRSPLRTKQIYRS